jgi:hypothetical protein
MIYDESPLSKHKECSRTCFGHASRRRRRALTRRPKNVLSHLLRLFIEKVQDEKLKQRFP